jgi:putative oxidoreductase
MNRANAYNLGTFILRLSVGGLLLLHGIDKLQNGIGHIEGNLDAKGLPVFIAYGVYIGEVVAPIFLLLGLWTRIAAAVIAMNMLFAIMMVHSKEIFATGEHGGSAIELPLLYLLGAVAIALIGGGAWSITKGKWN